MSETSNNPDNDKQQENTLDLDNLGAMQPFIEVFKALLKKKGVTLQTLASRIPYSLATVGRWHNEKELTLPPNKDAIDYICKALSCHPTEKQELLNAYARDILMRRGFTKLDD